VHFQLQLGIHSEALSSSSGAQFRLAGLFKLVATALSLGAQPVPLDDVPDAIPAIPLPVGTRAFKVKVSNEGVDGGFTLPGSRVDILATERKSSEEGVTRMAVENVLVLAVGAPEGKSIAASLVLAVTPAQEKTLKQAAAAGPLHVVLRRPGDEGGRSSAPAARGTEGSSGLAKGNRALAIRVPAATLAGSIVPGVNVDVVVTTRKPRAAASVLLEKVSVLAVDVPAPSEEGSPRPDPTVTLGVTLEQARRLSRAVSAGGSVRVLLRPPE
jgi:Flp pilus assembly protein CpaB